ncbi:autotransporter outer membrane beta-barrel domain-containing protein [uncultured Ruegeria sp.]|uniref:autotransporter family protein n=1 Tax=uncultured Ruegeria sp. TaxID=259304 RepID=UPI00261EA8FD|nr:autotransporter outer membrane beta-barrel domain-containing protein [uncultured Ruegeria sp.]
MSGFSICSKLVGCTSAIVLLIGAPAWAQIVVPDGDTLVVTTDTSTTEQINLGDGSSLIVESGSATFVGDVIVDTNDGTSVSVENNGAITANGGRAINVQGSTLALDNSGVISATAIGVLAENLSLLHNRSSGSIQGGLFGVGILSETISILNEGSISGDSGIASAGTLERLVNRGLVTGSNGDGIQADQVTLLENLGTVEGQDNGVFLQLELETLINSGTILGATGHGINLTNSGATILNEGAIEAAQIGIRVTDSLGVLVNSGTIRGGTDGVRIQDALSDLANEGTIVGQSGYGILVEAGAVQTVINSGSIYGMGSDGLSVEGISGFLHNTGTIQGEVNGVFVNGDLEVVRNSGTIRGLSSQGLEAGDIGTILNSGLIESINNSNGIHATSVQNLSNSGAIKGANHGVSVSNLHTLNNSGQISGANRAVSANGGINVLNNSGTIIGNDRAISSNGLDVLENSGTIIGANYAVRVLGGAGTNLILRQGSNIQGRLLIDGPVAFVSDPAMNLDLTFEEATISVENTSGAPYVLNGQNLVVVDPSGFNGTDLFANDLTRSVLDVVSSTGARIPLTTQEPGTERNVWISGFGGQNQVSGTGVLQDSYGGLVGGVDLPSASGSVFGLFGGFGTGDISADNSGNTLDTDAVFAGGYYHRDFGSKFLRASLVGGQLSSSGSRDVFNNLATGGVETASSDYDGYFVSPSIELGARFDNLLANKPLLASLQLSYLHLSEDGYTETGVANPVTVDDSQSDYLNARAQITLPHEVSLGAGPNALLEFTAGIDGQFAMGDTSRKASVLGSDIELDPIYDDQLVRGFLGGSFRKQTRDGRGLFSIGADGFFGGSDDREIRGTLSFQYVF